MTSHVQHLVELIDAFLAGQCDFAAFAAQYQDYLMENVPGDYLNDCELLLLGEVNERAEWTTAAPPNEDRAAGWIDVDEYSSWLAAYRESLPRLLPGRGVSRR